MPESTSKVVAIDQGAKIDANSKDRFINRELSWLAFNVRVLDEALNEDHPILERLRFLSISSSNLDEFYMVRVAGLMGQVRADIAVPSAEGLTPSEQLEQINAQAKVILQRQHKCWLTLKGLLADVGIEIVSEAGLSAEDKTWLKGYFRDQIYPVLTPIAVDPAHPFPFIPNLGLSVVVQLRDLDDRSQLNGLIPLPSQLERFIRLPGPNIRYLSLEHLAHLFLDELFPGFEVMDRHLRLPGSPPPDPLRSPDLRSQH